MTNCSDLLAMINSLLAATKLTADAAQPEIENVDLRVLLEELKGNYSVNIKNDVDLLWNIPRDLPPIDTDPEKLRHVLQNLVNNAIKYTDNGRVTISARHYENSEAVEFKVEDTGIGICAEVLPTIFEMFRQGGGSNVRSAGGIGLGLYIVKKLTVLLDGEVEVESQSGKGSTFTVTLPTRINKCAGSFNLQANPVTSSFDI